MLRICITLFVGVNQTAQEKMGCEYLLDTYEILDKFSNVSKTRTFK
jgi:hypothetical protein